MKLIFCLQINGKCFLKLILSFEMCEQRHIQITQNKEITILHNVFTIYLEEEVRDEVNFLHVNKHQSFLQVYFNTLTIKVSYKVILLLLLGMIKNFQYTQSNKFPISLQYLRILGMEFIFFECR